MNKFRFTLLLTVSLMLLTVSAFADSYQEKFATANHDYAEGKFQDAARLYEEVAASGKVSGNLYYNLGNTYFKLGKKGKAILNYEKAKQSLGEDEDLFANRTFAASLLEAVQPEDVNLWYEKISLAIRDILPPAGWFWFSWILEVSICVVLVFAIFYFPFRRRVFVPAVLLTLFLILSLFFFSQSSALQQHHFGIVISPKAEVRYSPSYSGGIAFELEEGLRAEILRRSGDWTQVRVSRDKSGWVESNAIEPI